MGLEHRIFCRSSNENYVMKAGPRLNPESFFTYSARMSNIWSCNGKRCSWWKKAHKPCLNKTVYLTLKLVFIGEREEWYKETLGLIECGRNEFFLQEYFCWQTCILWRTKTLGIILVHDNSNHWLSILLSSEPEARNFAYFTSLNL